MSSALVGPQTAKRASAKRAAKESRPARSVPEATVARLPVYLHALTALADTGVRTVSSGDLARAAGVKPAQLRKDLSHLGSYGTRGVGYDVVNLAAQIGLRVGDSQPWPVIIVGLGNLGRALANYAGFRSRGFPVVALVDAAPEVVGGRIEGLPITSIDDLDATVAATGATIAVIATPAEAAQRVCDQLVAAGITSILNFAATVLTVPSWVRVRKVDVGQEMQILAYHEQRKGPAGLPGAPAVAHFAEGES
ncbi:redox-sensing transcriptional repressor [Friedmanniella endophytica]|uniref:Redox-sensing transcriptional repressor Rex n=1 Tax=Microlunatus kandeliicorticis TaxID=1759536 RepID=A0A7W3IVR8_9ACTN|nr:redox-sensing transcriptional repressor Rex [Microlunatus kandeliicorticis]MBA8796178.1 redox-sensing transcriptional repressor [Microlunatus kandeliicorticis]